ncbi:MAG TPA: hypothetical protein PKM69_00970 [Bacteroidales bacterium]|nr:hypothetical protein [Bacteroidales bacterium]
MAGIVACDTADQDVSPVVSTDGYPTATFTNVTGSTSIKEGDTLVYKVTTDKPIDRSITFTLKVKGGTANQDDYQAASAVLQPYTTEAYMYIIAVNDGFPEVSENLQFEIGVYTISNRYILNPKTVFENVDLTIVNKNDPTLLTVVFGWDTKDDIDMVTWSDTPTNPHTEWGDKGATASNPETDKSIWLSDPVGTYYVNVLDYGADPFNYTFTIGHPDGSVQIIEGKFDRTVTTYTNDAWTAWGGSYSSFRVLKVVNDGTKFTVTAL